MVRGGAISDGFTPSALALAGSVGIVELTCDEPARASSLTARPLRPAAPHPNQSALSLNLRERSDAAQMTKPRATPPSASTPPSTEANHG